MSYTTAKNLQAAHHLIKVVVYPEDGGYCALVPSIPGIAAWAPNKEEAFVRIEDALRTAIRRHKDANTAIPWHPEGEGSMSREVKIDAEDMPCLQFTFCFAKPPNDRIIKESFKIPKTVAIIVGFGVAALVYFLTS